MLTGVPGTVDGCAQYGSRGCGSGGYLNGGGIKRANAAFGIGNLADDRYNVMFSAGWQKEDMLFGRDRSFSRSGINVAANNDTTSATQIAQGQAGALANAIATNAAGHAKRAMVEVAFALVG